MISELEMIKRKLEANSSTTDEAIIAELIKDHKPIATKMQEGVEYYNVDNKEIARKQPVYYDELMNPHIDKTAPNHKIKHGWHRLLVNQKTSYLTGKAPTITTTNTEELELRVNRILDEDFADDLNELVKNSSNKGLEWLHTYINKYGEFDYIVESAEGIIPIYDTSKQKELEALIKFYTITVNGESRIRAEYWDDQFVTYYVQNENGKFTLDNNTETGESVESHFYYNGNGYGWGKVPFIKFPNNEEELSDLEYYKTLIDDYDLVVSGLSDDLERVQQSIMILKGYEGESLAELTKALRLFKAVKVSEDGGIDKLEVEIPTDAKNSHLNRLEENIFLFGEGINMKTDKFGNSPSGVALRFMYALLDGKASILERKFKKAIKKLFWFVTEYINIVDKKNYNYKELSITFNKTMISNDLEVAQIIEKSPYLSDETKLKHHPMVVNVREELNNIDNTNE